MSCFVAGLDAEEGDASGRPCRSMRRIRRPLRVRFWTLVSAASSNQATATSYRAKVTEMSNKPGRNAPCPCGSGKKYKRCCLAIDESAAHELAQQQALFDDELPDDFELEAEDDESLFDTDYEEPLLDVRTLAHVCYPRGFGQQGVRPSFGLRRARHRVECPAHPAGSVARWNPLPATIGRPPTAMRRPRAPLSGRLTRQSLLPSSTYRPY
jgi:hypothetical protein